MPTEDLPEPIRTAFHEVALLPTAKVAKLLGLPRESLLDIIHANNLPSRAKGLGKIRPQRVFSIDDVRAIWQHLGANRQ